MMKSTKDGVRQAIGVIVGGLCFWYTKDGVVRIHEDYEAACSALLMSPSHCANGLYPLWQWTTMMSSIGAISVGLIAWYMLKFGPLGR